jgi:hypothetical protein
MARSRVLSGGHEYGYGLVLGKAIVRGEPCVCEGKVLLWWSAMRGRGRAAVALATVNERERRRRRARAFWHGYVKEEATSDRGLAC